MLNSFLRKIQSLDRPGSEKQPEAIFFLCALLFGLTSLFITPPFQSPDEYGHFFRAYYTAQGGLIGSPTALPVPAALVDLSLVFPLDYLPHYPENKVDRNVLLAEFARHYQFEPTAAYNINNTIFYPPISYLPQSLGIRIGMLLSLAPISIFYLGRLFNLLLWIFMVLVAIHLTPIHKWVLAMLALMPMTLFLSASTSPDALLTGLCFLFVAYFLRLYCLERPFTYRQMAVVLTLAALITLTKHIYGLIAGIYLFLPVACFNSRRRYLLFNGLMISLVGGVAISWYRFVSPMFVPDHQGALPQAQINRILSNPFQFAGLMLVNSLGGLIPWARMMVGVFGWLDTALPEFLYWVYLPVLVFVALVDGRADLKLPPIRRLGLLGVFLGLSLAVITSMFLLWTPVGDQEITGVQGRYFIPFVWLLFLQFYNQRLSGLKPLLNLLVFLVLIISLDSMLYSLVLRYYL